MALDLAQMPRGNVGQIVDLVVGQYQYVRSQRQGRIFAATTEEVIQLLR